MTIAFIEGFDKYGPAAANATTAMTVSSFVNASKGIWNASAGVQQFIGPPLASAGIGSLAMIGVIPGMSSTATLGGNYTRAIGGCYIKINTLRGPNTQLSYILFLDAGVVQGSIGFNLAGNILVMNAAGTIIGTSTGTVIAGTAFNLEWNIGMSNSATWQVWLNGSSILSGSAANFHGSANNFYQQIKLQSPSSGTQVGCDLQYDHLYVDDGTGAVLNSNPVIETDFPTSDSAVQFGVGAFALGFYNNLGVNGAATPGANQLALRKVTAPTGGATLNSVTIIPHATSAAANYKAVLYADSAGSPGALLATGTQVTGTTADTTLTLPFAGGQALTTVTSYWIGFITDTSVNLNTSDVGTTGWTKANTYASGAPNPAGVAGSTTAANWCLWGNCTGTTTNWIETSEQQPLGAWGDFGYVFDSTVGHEDLFGVNALVLSPSTIYAVAVSGFMKDNTAGARTVTLNTKSGGTDSPGTNAGFTPSTAYGWFQSMWLTDPNTSAAWTAANLNAALAGYKITA